MPDRPAPTVPCDRCNAICCKLYPAYVNAAEIVRLMAATGQDWPAFLEARPAAFPDEGVRLESGLFDLALRQSDHGCTFLADGGRALACTVHAARPGVCRAYPFQLRGSRLYDLDLKLCPEEWQLPRAARGRLRGELLNAAEEWRAFAALARRWNALPQASTAALDGFMAWALAGNGAAPPVSPAGTGALLEAVEG